MRLHVLPGEKWARCVPNAGVAEVLYGEWFARRGGGEVAGAGLTGSGRGAGSAAESAGGGVGVPPAAGGERAGGERAG